MPSLCIQCREPLIGDTTYCAACGRVQPLPPEPRLLITKAQVIALILVVIGFVLLLFSYDPRHFRLPPHVRSRILRRQR